MSKSYLYFILISILEISSLQAQTSSSFGQKKQGNTLGNNKGFGNSFGAKGFSEGSHSKDSKTKKPSTYSSITPPPSNSDNNTQYISPYKTSHTVTAKNNYTSMANNHVGYTSGSSKKLSLKDLHKNINPSTVGPYPGVNKPNKLSDAELKTGKKYSYPGLHNIRNNFEKKQKQLGTKTVNQ